MTISNTFNNPEHMGGQFIKYSNRLLCNNTMPSVDLLWIFWNAERNAERFENGAQT